MRTRKRALLDAVTSLAAGILLLLLPVQTGPVRGYLGDVLIVVFICSLVGAIFRVSSFKNAVGVFLFASLVEFLQLLRLDRLWGLEGSLLVWVTIGATFDPWDFAAYAVGAVVAFVLLRQRTERGREKIS